MTPSNLARRAALDLYRCAIRNSAAGRYRIARAFTRLASELLGCELACPISLAFGGVR